jgi:hypothetical protein
MLSNAKHHVVNRKVESLSIAQTVIEMSASREDAQVFTWASHALNNSFFLEHLVSIPSFFL